MKIGMMADTYKPHVSGITNYIELNKRALEAAGHSVYIFTFGDEDYPDTESNIIRSPGIPITDTGYYLSLRYTRIARKLLQTMDVVHVHHPFLSGALALTYAKPLGIPILFTNHTRYDLYSRAYLPALPEGISETFLRTYLPRFCASCDLVISPSPGMRNVLQQLGVTTPIEVVPNGVDFHHLTQPIAPIHRTELGFGDRVILLIYVGRLGPEKNLPFLLRAFGGIAQTFENLALLIVGDGPERDNLQDRVQHMRLQDKIHFTGMVPYSEIPRYLKTADVFVTASVTEVHPLTVIEAMAVGLPVIGIQSPGVGDLIEDDTNGLLAQEEDLAIFTAKLARIVTDHAARQRMAQNARQVSQTYAIERTSDLMLQHYQRLVSAAQPGRRSWRIRFNRLLETFRK
ncbi:MAG: glycosyltransferase family 4 protein [Anaerolineales bacterium]